MARLKGRKVVFLVADLTHDDELNFPKYWLLWEGADVVLVGLSATHTSKFGRVIETHATVDKLSGMLDSVDGVVIPGGFGPDKLRTNNNVQEFVREMVERGRVVGAICHGAQVLISADVVKGRRLTCWESVAQDVVNAGGRYVDESVVRDGNLITSRMPADLPAFTSALIGTLAEPKRVKKMRRKSTV